MGGDFVLFFMGKGVAKELLLPSFAIAVFCGLAGVNHEPRENESDRWLPGT